VAMDGNGTSSHLSQQQQAAALGVYAQRYKRLGCGPGGDSGSTPPPRATRSIHGGEWTATATSSSPWSSNNQDGTAGASMPAVQLPWDRRGHGVPRQHQTAGDQHYSAVDINDLGEAVVIWSGNGAGGHRGRFRPAFPAHQRQWSQPMEASDTFDAPAITAANADNPARPAAGLPNASRSFALPVGRSRLAVLIGCATSISLPLAAAPQTGSDPSSRR